MGIMNRHHLYDRWYRHHDQMGPGQTCQLSKAIWGCLSKKKGHFPWDLMKKEAEGVALGHSRFYRWLNIKPFYVISICTVSRSDRKWYSYYKRGYCLGLCWLRAMHVGPGHK